MAGTISTGQPRPLRGRPWSTSPVSGLRSRERCTPHSCLWAAARRRCWRHLRILRPWSWSAPVSVTRLYGSCARAFPSGSVDLGRLTASVARETIVGADRILVVVTPDERATLSARAVLTAAARWGAPVEHSGVVVNRWNRRAELSLRAISRTVGCEIAAVVRDRPNRMTSYTNGRVDLSVWPDAHPAHRASCACRRAWRPAVSDAFERLAAGYRERIRRELVGEQRGDVAALRDLADRRLRELVANDRVPLSAADVDRLVASVVDDTLGFGPLDGLLSDPAVTEVIVNGCEAVFAERARHAGARAGAFSRQCPPA